MTFPHMFVFAFLVAPGMAFSCFLAVFSSIWDRFGCPLRVFFGFIGALFLFLISGRLSGHCFFQFGRQPGFQKGPLGAILEDLLVSGRRSENCVPVLVLARFRRPVRGKLW